MREAIDRAHDSLTAQGASATLGFLFASARHALDVALDEAAARVPNCEWLGSQSAGEFTELGPTQGGVAVMLTSIDRALFEVGEARGVSADPAAGASALLRGYPDLVKRATEARAVRSTTLLLLDGLGAAGEQLVKQLVADTRASQQLAGGAAGDDGAFAATRVGTRRLVDTDAAVAVHVYHRHDWGIGVDHGLTASTAPMRVTRAQGNVVWELDGRPAFEVYREHAARRGVTLTEDNAATFLIGNELGVYERKGLQHARAPFAVLPGGALRLVAGIEQGAQVCILEGSHDALVAACEAAARQALAGLQGAPAGGVLVFDCICRGMVLGPRLVDELAAVQRVFPDVPLAGFLTYGEIAKLRNRLDGWHNSTVVVVAIPRLS